MDLRRLRVGEWTAAACGVALLVALFLPWYEGQGARQSGWESFALTDVVLAVAGLGAVGLFFATAVQRAPAVSIAYDALFTLAALVAGVAIAFRVLNLPDELTEREVGLWLGFAATLGLVAGGIVAMRDERLSKPGRPTDATGVPVEAPPEIETLPAPAREATQR